MPGHLSSLHAISPHRSMQRVHLFLTAALVAAAVAGLAIRTLSVVEPLGIDQSLWASAVRGMSRHQLLYRDVWEQRPPGIYFTYLAGFSILGWTPAAVAWLDIAASTVTALLIFFIVRRLSDTTIGALAAALYATLTVPGWLYRHDGFLERSVCETFIVVCVALSAWCAVEWRERSSPIWAAGIGLFAGAAVVFKPNAGLYFPAILGWLWLYRRESASRSGSSVARTLVIAVLVSAVPPVLTVLWLWHLGLLGDARVAVVDFNRFYVAQGFALKAYAVDFSKAIWLRMKTDPLWAAGGIGSLVVAWELARKRTLVGRRGRDRHHGERREAVQHLLHSSLRPAGGARGVADRRSRARIPERPSRRPGYGSGDGQPGVSAALS